MEKAEMRRVLLMTAKVRTTIAAEQANHLCHTLAVLLVDHRQPVKRTLAKAQKIRLLLEELQLADWG